MRLIPRWYAATVVVLLTLFTLGLAIGGLVVDTLVGRSMLVLAVATGLVLVSAWSALVRRRHDHEPEEVRADGTRVFRAPAATTYPLLGAWFALLVIAAIWLFLLVTDFDSLESPGFSIVTIGGALASLPDLVRLLTGRLHRWTLELGPETFTYRGYKTDLTVPWSEVKGAEIQQRGPAGVRVDLRGDVVDPVVPITAFDHTAEQLVREIKHGRRR